MRIISGSLKGRRIKPPKKLPVRPTTDMAKEALFNILNNRYYFDEISVLDLFAGTGSISYEFASRDTKNITSVENEMACVKFMDKTVEALNLQINVVKSDVFKFLKSTKNKFDIVFADPPYKLPDLQYSKIVELVFINEFLEKEGLLIIEHSKHTDLSKNENYSFSKSYGGNVFSFFEY